MPKVLTYVEVDIDFCGLTYGGAPCTASIPETGEIKCFNTLKTCQDRANFNNEPVTLRFAVPTDYLPPDIEAIPTIKAVNFTPGVVSLGENLGQRATLKITFTDHPWSDTPPGFDKYHAERPYDPWKQGTFWGKFRARQPFMRGRSIRIIRGTLGQTLDEMDTRHFVIDSFDGPKLNGDYSIIAKDVIKLADGDRAQAPRLSNGFLVASITDTDPSATLAPSGIGDAEYPASGFVAIGGKEICEFTRVGDVLTFVERGANNTEAQAHDDSDRVQLCLRYVAQNAADIIADLFENYADIPGSYIPIDAWLTETSNFLVVVFTTMIAEPTPVKQLVSELIEQAALAIWPDDSSQLVRLQVLRGITTDADRFTRDTMLEGSLVPREQPDKRLSQIWIWYGQINPLEPLDNKDNYRSTVAVVDLESESDYGSPAIKTILSRWMPQFGRPNAIRVGQIFLSRFKNPPRGFRFSLARVPGQTPNVVLGGGYRLEDNSVQDPTGAQTDVPIQITRLHPKPDRFEVEAEEMLFQSVGDLPIGTVIIDTNTNDFNLRTVHDTIYAPAEDGDKITCIIESAAIVGSTDPDVPAFDVGVWPVGVTIDVIVQGRIQGAGGKGGRGANANSNNATVGQAGGVALLAGYPINLTSDEGEVWGGAGGGGGAGTDGTGSGGTNGGSGGGGGSGKEPGEGGTRGVGAQTNGLFGSPGTPDAGGLGGQRNPIGGTGGDPGEAGTSGANGNRFNGRGGGAPGAAIDGNSFITDVGTPGDFKGARIN